ncbi:MAG: hypothetical protein R3B54_04995 [Bdellovibrionota bacterium]
MRDITALEKALASKDGAVLAGYVGVLPFEGRLDFVEEQLRDLDLVSPKFF